MQSHSPEPRQVLLNGVPIGHWDEQGCWVRQYGAAPYWPRPAMKRQQRLSLDWGSKNPRPMRNSDRGALLWRPLNAPMPARMA